MKRYDAAVVGEIYVDHILTGFQAWPQPGEEVFTQEYVLEVGGGAAITACALAHLGRTVSLVGSVGVEEMPWLGRRLKSLGVPITGLRLDEGRSGVTISVSTKEDRSFFTFVGANERLGDHLANDSVVSSLMEARHVHFAMPLAASLADRLIPVLHAAGCTISLDVGHQVAWLQDPANGRTCASVDYLLPNECEAGLLCKGDAESYLDFTRLQGWPSGLVKLGERGAAMRMSDRIVRAASPRVTVVDTTGAGDAFDAGFIDGLLDGVAGEECLRRGCVCGSMSTQAAGALRGLADRNDLQEFYEQSYG